MMAMPSSELNAKGCKSCRFGVEVSLLNQAAIKSRGGTMVSAVQMDVRRMRMKKKPKYAYITVIQFKYEEV